MVLAVNNLTGFGGGEEQREITFLQETVDGTGTNTYTFSSVNFGAASALRTIVVGVAVSSDGAPTSATVTIGGVSATVVATVSDAEMVDAMSLIAYASVPTGSSGDVVVNVDKVCRVCRIYTYRVIATTFGVHATATDVGTLSQSVSLASGGSIMAVSACSSSVATATWTGATEQADSTGDEAGSSALLKSSASSPVTIACTWSAGNAKTMSVISISYG